MKARTGEAMFGRVRRIHLVGIGGTGMSGIAEILLNLGFEVSGSDIRPTEVTERLGRLGATVVAGHESDLVTRADVAVVSSAIGPENREVRAAERASVPVIPRAELLAELMRVRRGIAGGGAHGKTTTTWLTGLVLAEGGLDPTIIVGGRLRALGSNAKLGGGEVLVAEADESDGTFLMLTPSIAVVTNIDREHVDFYADMHATTDAFLRFLNRVPFFGAAVVSGDDPVTGALLPRVTRRLITFGLGAGADIGAEEVTPDGRMVRFVVRAWGKRLGIVVLPVPGQHNVQNALAAVAVGLELEVPFEKIAGALERFRGIHRRMELLGDVEGRIVIDDYGHHPTEVRATLAAVRQAYPGRRILVLFQPHRYTRTSGLLAEFATAFGGADRLFLLDIYPASETPIPGVDSGLLARAIAGAGFSEPEWIGDPSEAVGRLVKESRKGDVLVTLGAGDIGRLGADVLGALGAARGDEGGGRA